MVYVLCLLLIIMISNYAIADDDGDSDGIADEYDGIYGVASDVVIYRTSSDAVISEFSIQVDGSADLSQYFVSTHTIIFYVASNPIIEFVYDFATAPVYGTATPPAYGTGTETVYAISSQTVLDLTGIEIIIEPNSGAGGIIIKGLDLTSLSLTKTAYIDKTLGTGMICIIDAEVSSITVSGDCTNGEKVTCDTASNELYSCTSTGSRYKITGLSHSAVTEYSFSVVNGGGGGGGGSSSSRCYSEWTCTEWSECINTYKRRTCTDENKCKTPTDVPEIREQCKVLTAAITKDEEEKQAEEEDKEEDKSGNETKAGDIIGEDGTSGKPGIINAITGAVIGTLGKNYIFWPILIILIIVAVSIITTRYYGGMPQESPLSRATTLHKKAQDAHKRGKHKKAQKLYKQAQKIREEEMS